MLQLLKYLALISALLLAAGLVSGCGKKGDLFLPPSTDTEQLKSTSEADKKKTTAEQQPVNSVQE